MSFPLSLLYFVYLALVGIFFLFSFFNLYHLLRFGSPRRVTIPVAFLYLAGAAALLALSWTYLQEIDWLQQVDLLPKNPGEMGTFE
ncbi:MAG: hypothetical protein PHI63_03780 [Patescibacteria group bacterium]|nr:hypothetical protein [Patescibacteria group bacterium]